MIRFVLFNALQRERKEVPMLIVPASAKFRNRSITPSGRFCNDRISACPRPKVLPCLL